MSIQDAGCRADPCAQRENGILYYIRTAWSTQFEVLERRQQERTEPAFLAVHGFQIILLQQPGEKLLRQILRILPALALAADEGVERWPVSAADKHWYNTKNPPTKCKKYKNMMKQMVLNWDLL